jgi:hypothetical protein
MLASGTMASVASLTVIVRDAKSCEKSTPVKQRNSSGNHLRMSDFTWKNFAHHVQAHHDSTEKRNKFQDEMLPP